eukprot:5022856-Alexandrium_andersonii.AAC.1
MRATPSKHSRAQLILRQDSLNVSLCCWALGARAASVAVAPQLVPTDYAFVDAASLYECCLGVHLERLTQRQA